MGGVGSLWEALDDQLMPLLSRYRRNLATLHVDRKADNTLLSEADLATQEAIVNAVEQHFPGSRFVAEEDDPKLPTSGDPTWVIDPIDGTSQFVSPEGREFCSVVCRLDAGVPTAAYVLAPELGVGRTPIAIHWADEVLANGQPAKRLPPTPTPRRASMTRSKYSEARAFESNLAEIGCAMKIRTTSQTLDMVRASIDLSTWTATSDHQYDLFYRPDQKVWDGVAGIGLALAMGRVATAGDGRSPLPLDEGFLHQREPTFAETIAGEPDCVRWFVNLLAESRSS
ncbi:inositol monophosphatase family protein [Nocardia pseudovaccinii]|uniref:inositol monophosphatase family protein n=1 Tax=Nocardia pseudovaccinii TaxID=189540 RepID=UPI003D9498FF